MTVTGDDDDDRTISTLKFAALAKAIKNEFNVNIVPRTTSRPMGKVATRSTCCTVAAQTGG